MTDAEATSAAARLARSRAASFVRACELDVLVRKPGNVSRASPGHGMHAGLFVAAAGAAAGPLFETGARVGARIEAAVDASWRAAGCNTNLGIVLLAAPLARAAEASAAEASAAEAGAAGPGRLRPAVERVLGALDRVDAEAAYRAIVRASPGGLGSAAQEDVRAAPSVGLRDAMALAAARDSIARQYRDGYAELFEVGLPALPPGFALMGTAAGEAPDAATTGAVQRVYLGWLARIPDSHIVRKHGEAVAQTVMTAAQRWRERADAGDRLDADAGFVAWDEALKAARINPGTSADLTVATLLLAALASAG